MTLGVAVSVKSDLGVSPISSIPYTMTCATGLDLGVATIVFSVIMVLLQAVVLRKNFSLMNFLQLPVGIIFGMFMTFCCGMIERFPDPANMAVQLIMMLISTFIVAVGVFMYVPAGFIPLAPEGLMLAIVRVGKFKFANVKICFDVTMVTISAVSCLIILKELGSVGIGTVVAAVLVGTEVKMLVRFFGEGRDRLLGNIPEPVQNNDITPLMDIMKRDVYTVKNDTTIRETLSLMRDKKISGCPVTDQDGNLIGFISDGDIIRQLKSEHSIFVNSDSFEKIEFNKALTEVMAKEVSQFAVKKVITVNAGDDLSEVCYKLGENHLKKAPVMQDGKMIGIINVSNIIKYATALMEEQSC